MSTSLTLDAIKVGSEWAFASVSLTRKYDGLIMLRNNLNMITGLALFLFEFFFLSHNLFTRSVQEGIFT